MAVIRKFMFDTDFAELDEAALRRGTEAAAAARGHDPVPEPEPEPEEPPPPTFSEEELALARERAYEQGVEAGRAEAGAALAATTAAALQTLASRLEALQRDHAAETELRHRDAVRVALAVAERVLPDLAARHAMGEIEALFTECMSFLLDEPRVTVRVGAGLLEEIRPQLEAVAEAAAFEGRLTIIGDAHLALGDCRIEWAQGGAERDWARLWRDIQAVLVRALGADAMAAPELKSV